MYWPLEEMVPAPLLASPPLTDQVTGAAAPFACAAKNCSTALPEESVALQPVQLVSMDAVEGERLRPPLAGEALLPQPATSSIAGAAAQKSARNVHAREARRCAHPPAVEGWQTVAPAIDAVFLNSPLDQADRGNVS